MRSPAVAVSASQRFDLARKFVSRKLAQIPVCRQYESLATVSGINDSKIDSAGFLASDVSVRYTPTPRTEMGFFPSE